MVNDNFVDGISLSYLNLFAMFDRTLQNTLFQYSLLVETSFKTALSYVISKKFGVFEEEYLNKDKYIRSNNSKTKKLLEEIKSIYKQPYRWMNHPTNRKWSQLLCLQTTRPRNRPRLQIHDRPVRKSLASKWRYNQIYNGLIILTKSPRSYII